MKLKSLLALALILTTVGLSFPAAADDRDGGNQDRSDRKSQNKRRNQYYGKYHYYKLSDGSHIYIGSKGDYWDRDGKYYPDTESNDYEKYYDTGYDFKKGDYYESGRYYPKKEYRQSRQSYYGKYHYYKLSDGSHIYIGSKGDYWDQKGTYYPDTPENDYEKYHDTGYDFKKGDYYESGRYYNKAK
jgi:hypothetical protein